MRTGFFTFVFLLAMSAQANGYLCLSDTGFSIQVYADPTIECSQENEERAVTMVIADTRLPRGQQTLAKFFASEGTLDGEEYRYFGTLKGAALAHRNRSMTASKIKVSDIENIELRIHFANTPSGYEGELTFHQHDGGYSIDTVACRRYLNH